MSALNFETVIVGAGPAGCACALELLRLGHSCCIVDKRTFPRDKLCGGLFTDKASKALEGIVGTAGLARILKESQCVQESRFVLCNGTKEIVSCNPERHIRLVDRRRFDKALLDAVVLEGGMVITGEEIASVDFDSRCIKSRSGLEIGYDYLVAADGALSTVRRLTGDNRKKHHRQPSLCLEINVDVKDYSCDGVCIYFGIVPKSYAWTFPKGDKTCIGLVKLPDTDFDVNSTFRKFLEELHVSNIDSYPFKGAMIPIDCCPKRPVYGEHVLFVGDAAGLVQSLTGEGIYYAISSGRDAADSIVGASSMRPDVRYVHHISRYRHMMHLASVYQRMLLEWGAGTEFLLKHASSHPNFIRHFYDTQIDQEPTLGPVSLFTRWYLDKLKKRHG